MSTIENDRLQQLADSIDNKPASLNSVLQMMVGCQKSGVISLHGHTVRTNAENFPNDYRFFVAPNPPILVHAQLVEFAENIAHQNSRLGIDGYWDEPPFGYLYRIPEISFTDHLAGYKVTRIAYPQIDEALARQLDFRPVHLDPRIIPQWLRVDASVKFYPHPELADAAYGRDLAVAHAKADYSYLAEGFIHRRWIRNLQAGRDISHAGLVAHTADAAIGLLFRNYPPESV